MSGWSPALRIARRELLRAKGRTLLVLLMVLLPVTAVCGLSTLLRTADVDPVEGLPSTLGGAQARIELGTGRVEQDPLLRSTIQYENIRRATAAQVLEVLPAGARLLEVRDGADGRALRVDGRRVRVSVVGVDLSDPSRNGPFPVLQGRAPTAPGEVAVSAQLLDRGVRLGESVDLGEGPLTVTGAVGSPSDYGYGATVFGTPEVLRLQDPASIRYWVSGPEVTWEDVLELNALGGTVLSRAVVLDPPDVQLAETYDSEREVTLAVIGLIAVMAVLEVVLLAGPAFAVGARRQRRQLALLAATGGEPAHVRRVVLAQGLLVGLVAAVVGVPLGVLAAALLRGPLRRYGDATFGPFDVAPLDLLLVGLLGAGTALLAALLPAVVMARQPIVAALQGRRLTPARAARPAVLGLVLLAAGVLLTLAALDQRGFGYRGYAELGVAFAAVPTVLGAVLLAPAALSLVGRSAGRLPLPLRFAVRDADRQRGRTAPAVAAIAATVAGVVALGTAASSDAAEQRLTYTPSGPPGTAIVASYGAVPDWTALEQAAEKALPGQAVQVVRGLPQNGSPTPDGYTEVQICRAAETPLDGRCFDLMSDYSSGYGSDLLVGVEAAQVLAPQLGAAGAAAVERAVQAGQVVVASPVLEPGERVELRLSRYRIDDQSTEQVEVLESVSATAIRLPSRGSAPVRAVLPEAVAAQLAAPATVALAVGEDLSRADERRLQAALRALDDGVDVRVERGYSSTDDRTALLVLSLVAGLLVLGGTLAATSLALTEARPDLSTLGQVGARPRTRRAVAAGYALVLGVVGAVLGTAAGLVPGIAAAVPLTRGFSSSSSGFLSAEPPPQEYVIDVPWALLALVVVVLPLVAAGVAAASARGRSDAPRRVLA